MRLSGFIRRSACVAGLSAIISVYGGPAFARSNDPATTAATAAYDTAILCFVANGNASEDRRRANDPVGADRYDANAKRSFDTAVRLGASLRYSNERINADLGVRMDRELARMVREPAYYRQIVANCRAYGLM